MAPTNYNEFYNESQSLKLLFSKIKNIIVKSNNPYINYYSNYALINELSLTIAKSLIKKSDIECLLKDVEYIFENLDYRIVAEYINDLDNSSEKRIIEAVRSRATETMDYLVSRNANYNIDSKVCGKLIQRHSLKELFDETDESQAYFYANDKKGKEFIDMLQSDSGGDVAEYIESQKDLLGMFSLVRKGLIKKIQLSNGGYIISKKNNPEKLGKFQNEQRIVSEISYKLGFYKNSEIKYKDFSLSLVNPSAIISIPKLKRYYSISAYQSGKTLEEVLINEKNEEKRKKHFKNLKKILDLLYDNGIIWTDMAPRNIIISGSELHPIYYILDFEKSKILNHSATQSEREEHLRGPVCVEEFGAICSLDEIKQIFDFNPDAWDFSSNLPVPFERPKREILAIFKGRGKQLFSFAEYNKLEREIINVRLPIIDNGQTLYPLHCSFKVDHYLGEDYDRKLTEIFLSSKKYGLFCKVIRLIDNLLTNFENKILIYDFDLSCGINIGKSFCDCESNKLKLVIDEFYGLKNQKNLFEKSLNKFALKETFLKNYNEGFSLFNGGKICQKNFSDLRGKILNAFKSVKYPDNVTLIFLSGGYGRGEISPSSDLDMGIIGENLSDFKNQISNCIYSEFGIAVEYYPFSKSNLKKFIFDNPQYTIDVLHSKVIYLKPGNICELDDIKKSLLSNNKFLDNTIDFYLKELNKKSYKSKLLIESINFLICLAKEKNEKNNFGFLNYYKSILISDKLYRYYNNGDSILYPKQLERIRGDTIELLLKYKNKVF